MSTIRKTASPASGLEKLKKLQDNRAISYLAPIIVTVIISLVFSALTKGRFLNPANLSNILNSAYALALNMASGRMDLSLGGQQLIGCVIGGNMALALGLDSWGVLVLRSADAKECAVINDSTAYGYGIFYATGACAIEGNSITLTGEATNPDATGATAVWAQRVGTYTLDEEEMTATFVE